MKKLRLTAVIMVLVMMVILLAACGEKTKGSVQESTQITNETTTKETEPKPEKKTYKVGFSLFYRSDEYYLDIESTMKKEAEELGIELITQDANTDLAKQIQHVEDFVSNKVDAILMAPCDPIGSLAAVKTAKDAGIPVFMYDGITEDLSDVVAYTLSDYKADGAAGGIWAREYIEKNLGGKANVAIIDFPPSPVVCGLRVQGFIEEVTKLPGVKIVAQQDGKATRTDGMAAMENILTANDKNIDLVFAINYESGAGAEAAIKAADAKTVVVCVAWNSEGFEKMEKGDPIMKAYVTSNPGDHAKILPVIIDHLNGKKVEQKVFHEYFAVDHKTLNEKIDWKSIVELRSKQ
jgi:ribose transport system substrate-binding protein